MKIHAGLLVVGLIFFLCGLAILCKELKKKRNNTSTAMAEVTGYHVEERERADERSIIYYPILRYYAAGQWYEKQWDVGRGKETYARGERVEILYDPEHPDSFLIAGDHTGIILSIVAILLGVGCTVMAFFTK